MKAVSKLFIVLCFTSGVCLYSNSAAALELGLKLPKLSLPKLSFNLINNTQAAAEKPCLAADEPRSSKTNGDNSAQAAPEPNSKTIAPSARSKPAGANRNQPARARNWRSMLPGALK